MIITIEWQLSRDNLPNDFWGGGLWVTSGLEVWLGRGVAGLIPRIAFGFYGGENACVHSLCMSVGVRTVLLAFTQISSFTERFKLTCQKLTLKSFDH